MKDTGRQFILTFMSTILKLFWQRQSTLARNVSKNSKVVHTHPSHFAAIRSAMVSAWWGPMIPPNLRKPHVRFWPLADMPKNAIDVAIGGKADMTSGNA